MTTTTPDIKEAIIQHCKTIGLHPDEKGYVSANQDNLVDKFDNWTDIERELGEGQGSELKPDKHGKFKAVHSSSALCVNNFAPFKQNKDKFSFLNHNDFTEATFEKKLPTGLGGTPPHLDFYLENNNTVIGFESKFIEILNAKLPNQDNNLTKYQNRQDLDYLPDTFSTIIQDYIDYQEKLFLDVAQLIKHSIGLINKGRSTTLQPILVYIYWQPKNWYDFEVYRRHADEINDFKDKLDRHIPFIPISYLDFWKLYENDSTFGQHIDKVKGRYYFDL